MGEDEKLSRQAALYKVVHTHTSHTWAATLVKMLLSIVGTTNMSRHTPALDQAFLKEKFDNAKRRLLMFDYDVRSSSLFLFGIICSFAFLGTQGTLTPIVKTPSLAVPSPEALEALDKLSNDPKNVVYIISGRDSGFLDQHLGHLPKLGFSAEHGGFIKKPAAKDGTPSKWENLTDQLDMSWMSEVKEIFEYYTERTTGSFIEMKKSSITWHYRAADPEWGLFQCRQCLDLLETNVAPKRPIEGELLSHKLACTNTHS